MKNDILNTKKLGYKFYFQDGDNQIACFGSYFTGKEEVFINDELVSSKRSVGRKSTHRFEFKEHNYQVKYHMLNIITGKLECTFFKNNEQIKQQEQTVLPFIKDPKRAVLFFTASVLAGYLGAHLTFTLIDLVVGK
ncbi:hypothetical protein [Pseudoalteromonas sp. MMG007]|uniref:hypothetical protein n=1 Tax=Pseudoalteromonas sp. MMG007 TaxID=2822684 RepID=UPI001B38E19A|nr:hypothetical protein [Pseudoalteromonas sp. MMG007]MBQ4857006.1 hypothetical protein [Pseudoalteromonas sp. MMG007]